MRDALTRACCFPLHQVVVTHSVQGGKLYRDGDELSPVPSITKDSLTVMDGPAGAALAAGRLRALTSLAMEMCFSIPESSS